MKGHTKTEGDKEKEYSGQDALFVAVDLEGGASECACQFRKNAKLLEGGASDDPADCGAADCAWQFRENCEIAAGKNNAIVDYGWKPYNYPIDIR